MAKYCVHSIAAVAAPNTTQSLRRPRRIAWTWAPTARVANSMNWAYIRASCEYHTQNGAKTPSVAATQPVRRSKITLPVQYSAGISATPAMSDGRRTAASEVPNSRTVIHSRA